MRCVVVCVNSLLSNNFDGERTLNNQLNEFMGLVSSLETLVIVKKTIVNITKIKAGTFFTSGKLSELMSAVSEFKADLVLIDTKLSPMQQRNLERFLKAKVIDRTGLILEIFGSRAQTREGVLQVELAHLEYQRSRLVRSWTHLERQRGGVGFMGGPGETQIESDRRAIAEKIVRIKKLLIKVMNTRFLHRKSRKKNQIPIVALVGYTNVGKSSIFNYLTESDVLAKDMLFATLDPTMRAFNLLGKKKVILSDTVGFISKLPTTLISAFKATLEEVINADLIIHVRDISDPENKFQALNVEKIIDELQWDGRMRPPIIEIYNKIDKLNKNFLDGLINKNSKNDSSVFLSAASGNGFQTLEKAIWRYLEPDVKKETIFLNFNQAKKRAWLFSKNVVSSEDILDNGFSITVVWSYDQKNLFNRIVC